MRAITAAALALGAAGCSDWPEKHVPNALTVERTLYSDSTFGLREGCNAMVVSVTRKAASAVHVDERTKSGWRAKPLNGWRQSPIAKEDEGQMYSRAFKGCDSSGTDHEIPLGDLPGALKRPGAYYKLLNGGEAIIIVVPKARLAGFFNFG